jgi:hypothetical protein
MYIAVMYVLNHRLSLINRSSEDDYIFQLDRGS